VDNTKLDLLETGYEAEAERKVPDGHSAKPLGSLEEWIFFASSVTLKEYS
jgi:hypothetical protein